MKIFPAAVFAVVIALALPAMAQVRPFSQLTVRALEVQDQNGGVDVDIHIGHGDRQDQDEGRPEGPGRDQGEHQGRGHNNNAGQDSQGIGGWGGFGFGYFLPVLHGFDGLTKDRGLDADQPVIDTWYGRGFVTWQGFRFGGMGGGGSYHISDVVMGDDRSANINVGYGGVTFDYLVPLGNEHIGITLGGAMGGGGTWLSARGADLGGDEYWGEWTGFRFIGPQAGISILTIPWVRIEFTYQYLFMDVNLRGSEFVSDSNLELVDTDFLGGPVYTMWFLFGHD